MTSDSLFRDNSGRPLFRGFSDAVALGSIFKCKNLTIFGVSSNVQTTQPRCNIWDANIKATFPATAQSLELVSSSANDSSSGTGARSVVVTTLDGDFNEIVQVVVPNGTTAVALTGTHIRFNAASVTASGSGHVNAGNLTIRIAGGGATMGYIGAGLGAHRGAFFTVPAGKTFLAHNFFVIVSNAAGGTTQSATIDPVIYLPDLTTIFALSATYQIGSNTPITVPDGFVLTEKLTASYEISAVSNNGIGVSFGATGILIDNSAI